MVTAESIVSMVQDLAETFDVPMPLTSCNPRRRISCYKWRTKEIQLSKNILARPEAFSVVIHEFAHHVDFVRNPVGSRPFRKHHDGTFQMILLEVVDAVYSSRDEYFWHLEYKSIRNRFAGYVIASKKKFQDRVAAAAEVVMKNLLEKGVAV